MRLQGMKNVEQNHTRRTQVMSAISALMGLWLVIAPTALRVPAGDFARSAAIAGALIVAFSVIRFLSRHTAMLSWATAIVAAWVIMSPWVLGYLTAGFRTWSFVLVGAGVGIIAFLSLTSSAVAHPWTPQSPNAGERDKLLR